MRWVVAIGVLVIGLLVLSRLDLPLWLSLILEVIVIAMAFSARAAYDVFAITIDRGSDRGASSECRPGGTSSVGDRWLERVHRIA